ncbi:hypothetical protein Tco_1469282 [Tanacetum coccineum]
MKMLMVGMVEKMDVLTRHSWHAIPKSMSSDDFKALLVEEFCPRNEMKTLENDFWNHKMVGANHAAYTDWFHELAKLVPHLVTPESSRIKSAGILTDEAVSCGTLMKGNEKRKGIEETMAHVNAVRMGYNHRVCFECGCPDHLRNTCPKMHRAPGQAGNPLALEGNRNVRNNGNPARGRAFNINVANALQDPNVVTDLIPLGHGSFDVIVGMDWLSKNKAMIVCYKKVVEIPLEGGGILRVQGERTLRVAKALMNAKVDEPKLSEIPVSDAGCEVSISSSTLGNARIIWAASRGVRQGELNTLTVKNRYPLLRIDDLFD